MPHFIKTAMSHVIFKNPATVPAYVCVGGDVSARNEHAVKTGDLRSE